jgi:hypothetical protein
LNSILFIAECELKKLIELKPKDREEVIALFEKCITHINPIGLMENLEVFLDHVEPNKYEILS